MKLTATPQDIVTVHYTLAFLNGTVFDATPPEQPLSFQIGEAVVLPGLEKAVIGMEMGETKTITLLCKDAFGPRQDALISQLPRTQLPPHITCVKNHRVEITLENRPPLQATIIEVTDTHVTLDANPPQAGKDMVLTLELLLIA